MKWYDGADFAMDLSYQITNGTGKFPAISIGIAEVSIDQYISPAGSEETFNDENYVDRPPEIASAYIVGTKKLGKSFELTAANISRVT